MNKAIKRKHETVVESTKGDINKHDLFCDVCKIKLPNKSSMDQHILGQKHKRLDAAQQEQRRIERKCGIFVRGYPPSFPQDYILNYFSKYGKIVWVHFGHAFALLDYNEPSCAQYVMRQDHYLGGHRIMIQYRKLRKEVTIEKPKVQVSTDYIHKIKSIPKFDDQVEALIQHLQPSIQEQIPKYTKICDDLYEILSYAFPRCDVHRFGSTTTGLDFESSDIDVYISGIRQDENDIPYLHRTKALLSNSGRFANLIVIGRAKIPILKCVHVQTLTNCDINLRNQLGICNSRLITYYLKIDPKVKNLMMFLKYWGKEHRFTGQGYLFSNYALCMMLIFFLQQDPYNIPSVLSLQKNPYTFSFHDGWNGGFEEISVDTTSLMHTPLLKLLEDFFCFYADFQYGTNVICPFLGRTVKKIQFDNPETLPDCFERYKLYLREGKSFRVHAAVCIQDPFEHCRNITPVGSPSDLRRFITFCHSAKKLCQDGENLLLYTLLKMTPPDYKSEVVIEPEFSKFSIPMGPNLRYIEEKVEDTSNGKEPIRDAWFKSFVDFTKIVLKDFLKFDLTELDDPTKEKNSKCEGQSDVYDKQNRVSYQCTGKINLWEGRKVASKENKRGMDEKNQGIIKREMALTDHLCQLYKDIPQAKEIINFEITLENSLLLPEAIVNIKKKSAFKNIFKTFAVFLSSNLRCWFDLYERELNLCKK